MSSPEVEPEGYTPSRLFDYGQVDVLVPTVDQRNNQGPEEAAALQEPVADQAQDVQQARPFSLGGRQMRVSVSVCFGSWIALLLVVTAPARGQTELQAHTTIQAQHNHRLRGSCVGQLTILEDRVSFESVGDVDHSRQWFFADIREVKQDGIYKIEVTPFLGNNYDLELSGRGLNSQEFGNLVDSIAAARILPGEGRATAAAADAGIQASTTIQAQHNHRFRGSCVGQLTILGDRLSFESVGNVDHSRQWFFGDIREVKQDGIYKLEVTPFLDNGYDFEFSGRGLNSQEFGGLVDKIAAARVQ